MKSSNEEGIFFWLLTQKRFSVSIWLGLLFFLSVVATYLIPLEIFPQEHSDKFIFLSVGSSESVSVEKMESRLGLPLEGSMRSLAFLKDIKSSISERSVSLSLTFKAQANLDELQFQISEIIQELARKLPIDLKRVTQARFNPEAAAVISLSITQSGVKDFNTLLHEDIKTMIESLPQVSKVEISGLEPVVYEYIVPTSALESIRSSPLKSMARLRPQNISEIVGEVPTALGKKTLTLKATLKSNKVEDLENSNLQSLGYTPLRSIATKRISDGSLSPVVHKDETPTVFLEIFNKTGANLFELKSNLNQAIKQALDSKGDLAKVRFDFVLDQTQDLKAAIEDVKSSLYQSIAISFLVVFVFFRNIATTLLIASTVPLSLVLTVLLIYLKGSALNLLTLAGLVLSIGMVVDNAVVVVDSIKSQFGKLESLAAAAYGAQLMSVPMLTSTLATVTIFLPVAFLNGGDSFLDILKAFQLPMIASLLGAYVIAMLLVPLIFPLLKISKKEFEVAEAKETQFQKKLAPYFRWIQNRNRGLLVFVALLTLIVWRWVNDIETVDIDPPRDPYSQVSVKFGNEVKPEVRRDTFLKIRNQFLQNRKTIDFDFLITDFNPRLLSGTLQLFPVRGEEIEQTLNQLDLRIKDYCNLQKWPPGVVVEMGFGSFSNNNQKTQYTYQISGPKLSKILEIQSKIGDQLKDIEGFSRLADAKESMGYLNLVFKPLPAVLKSNGLSISDIVTQVGSINSQMIIQDLESSEGKIIAKIQFFEESKKSLDSLKKLTVTTPRGTRIALEDLGEFITTFSLSQVSRQNGIMSLPTVAIIKDDLNAEQKQRALSEVAKVFSNFEFPVGYGPPLDQTQKRLSEMKSKSIFVIALAILLIYLILASLFESILVPVAIMLTVPLAVLFGVAGLQALGLQLDVMARISLVMLVGIATNNSIILVDVFESLRKSGYKLSDAIVMGLCQRFKAVLMSTVSSVLSVLPVALGNSKLVGIPYASLGISMISGILFSSILTLLILPGAYELARKLESSWSSFKSSELNSNQPLGNLD